MVNLNEPSTTAQSCHPERIGPAGGFKATMDIDPGMPVAPESPILARLKQLEIELSELKNRLSQILTEHENRLARLEGRMGI